MNWRSPLLVVLFAVLADAQNAQISGVIFDPSEARISGAEIALRNEQTGGRRNTRSNESGLYSLSALRPGVYRLTVQAAGFETVVREEILLEVGQSARIDISLQIGAPQTIITVDSSPNPGSLEGAAIGGVISRKLIDEMPLNGRGLQTLIELTPGVTASPVSEPSRGQFNINGQRSDANYFTVDGISANFAAGNSRTLNAGNRSSPATIGQAGGGMLPAHNFLGTFSNLLAPDAVQEFRIQTSMYAAEFGHLPGGQIDLVSRSGSNHYSASLFEYVRNDKTDANDWFNNAQGLTRPPLRFNNFGGSLGGPVQLGRWYNGRDRTFFFLSADELLVSQPLSTPYALEVPTAEARQNAPPELAKWLSVFPLPRGPAGASRFLGGAVDPGFGVYAASGSRRYDQRSVGLRIDQVLPRGINFFFRVNHAPSTRVEPIYLTTQANRETYRLNTDNLTLGVTQVFKPNLVNDFRFGWSRQFALDSVGEDNTSGAKNPDDAHIFLPGYSSADSFTQIILQPLPMAYFGLVERNRSSQFQAVDNLYYTRRSHRWQFGGDARAFRIGKTHPKSTARVLLTGIYDAQGAYVSTASFSPSYVANSDVAYLDPSFSAYAQDTWRLSSTLTLNYGVRWEMAPATRTTRGRALVLGGLQDLNNPLNGFLVPQGKPFYPATWNNFAPRFGLGWNIFGRSSNPTILRLGAGRFFSSAQAGFQDNAPGETTSAPYQNVPLRSLFNGIVASPNLSLNDRIAVAAAPNYRLPVTYQWSATLEQVMGAQTASISYVGAQGDRLIGYIGLLDAPPNPAFPDGFFMHIVGNNASSSYHSMQVQLNRRLGRRLQVLASYTWSHSIDNLSNDVGASFLDRTLEQYLTPNRDRGSSDFDVRHSLNGAIIAQLPAPHEGIWAAALGHWSAQSSFVARSALPTDILSYYGGRVNYVYGVPLYLYGSYPGGKRYNPDAFADPTPGESGNLGRNVVRGFGAWQIDLALHRDVHLTESTLLQFRVEAFNVLNHPNFANPTDLGETGQAGRVYYGSNSQFGVASEMLSTGLGRSLIPGELNPLFQIGGPRVLQFGIRLLH